VFDQKHSQKEVRYHALGKNNNARLLHVTFTLRSLDTLIRVISVRDMHRNERNIYEQPGSGISTGPGAVGVLTTSAGVNDDEGGCFLTLFLLILAFVRFSFFFFILGHNGCYR